jgi:hypothetical protein
LNLIRSNSPSGKSSLARIVSAAPPEQDRAAVERWRRIKSEDFDAQNWWLQVVGVWNERLHPQFVENIAYETKMDNSSDLRETGKQHEQVNAKQKPGAG